MSRLHIEFTHIRCNQTEDKGDLFGDLSEDEFYITGSAIVGSAIKPILVSAVPDVNEKFKPIDIDDGQTLPIPSITGDIVADFDDNASDIILGAQAFDEDAADDKNVKNWIDLANAITDGVKAIGGDKVKTGTGLATAAIKAIDAARQSDKNDPLGTPLLLNQGDLSVSQLDPRSPIWLGRTWPLEPPRGTSWWNSYSYNVDYRIWREDYDFAVRDANSTFPNQLFSPGQRATAMVTFRNIGHATFVRDSDHATTLRAAGTDATAWLDTADPRVVDGISVRLDQQSAQPGEQLTFTLPLKAPSAGEYYVYWTLCVDGLPLGRYTVPNSDVHAHLVSGEVLRATVALQRITEDANGVPTATFIVRAFNLAGEEITGGHVTLGSRFLPPPSPKDADPILGQPFEVRPHVHPNPDSDPVMVWPDGFVTDGPDYRGTWVRLAPNV